MGYGALHSNHGTHFLEPIHKGETINDCCEHAHRVPGRSIDSLVTSLQSSKNISATDYQSNLDPHVGHSFYLLAYVFERLGVNRLAFTATPKDFATDLEHYSLVLRCHELRFRGSNILDFDTGLFIFTEISLVV
jgi:hypothetical protein